MLSLLGNIILSESLLSSESDEELLNFDFDFALVVGFCVDFDIGWGVKLWLRKYTSMASCIPPLFFNKV